MRSGPTSNINNININIIRCKIVPELEEAKPRSAFLFLTFARAEKSAALTPGVLAMR